MEQANAELWAKVKALAADALEQPPPEREQWVRRQCDGDSERAEAVLRLLGFASVVETAPMEERPLIGRFSNRKIGRYQVHFRLGAGGIGEVYLATRTDTVRMRVAIKFLRPDCTHPGLVRRFRAEAQILAALDHPNIVKLIDAGETDDGQPWFVMEYVEGTTIDQYCADQQLPVHGRLALFRDVCMAAQYAHGHLLVHRDLKPGNILVTKDGVLKLLDFGIAKLLHPELLAGTVDDMPTAIWDRPLTPAYASPEQLSGGVVTTAADVYSLGVVLFELLTGALPFQPPTPDGWHDFVRSVRQNRPPRPSTVIAPAAAEQAGEPNPAALGKRLRGDLDNIVLKALEKAPQRRYLTAQEIAEDLDRFERGLPVRAHPDSFGYRAWKFARRNAASAAAVAAVIVSLAVGLTVALQQKALASKSLSEVGALAQSMAATYAEVQNSCLSVIPAAKAVTNAEAAAAAAPKNAKIEDQLANSYTVLIDTLHANRQAAQADQTARKLIDLRTTIARERPQDASAQRDLVTAMQRYAPPPGPTSGFAGASAAVSAPAAPHLDDTAALNLLKLGDILRLSGDTPGAARAYSSSLDMYRDLRLIDSLNVRLDEGIVKAQAGLRAIGSR